MKFVVKEISHETHRCTRKWIVDIDLGESCNYRSRTSLNAFFYGKHKRNVTKDFLYYGKPLSEAIELENLNPDTVEKVESIWKFYEIIGYDYKKKKFK